MLYLTTQPIDLVRYLYPQAQPRDMSSLEPLLEGNAINPCTIAGVYTGAVPADLRQSAFNTCYLSVPAGAPWKHLIRQGLAEMLIIDLKELYAPLYEEVAPGLTWLGYVLEPEAQEYLLNMLRGAPRRLRGEQIRLTLLRQQLGRVIARDDLVLGSACASLESVRRTWGTDRCSEHIRDLSNADMQKFIRSGALGRYLGACRPLSLVAEVFKYHTAELPGPVTLQCLLHLNAWCQQRGLTAANRNRWHYELNPTELIELENVICQN